MDLDMHDPWEPADHDWRSTVWALLAIVEAEQVMREIVARYRRVHLVTPLEAVDG